MKNIKIKGINLKARLWIQKIFNPAAAELRRYYSALYFVFARLICPASRDASASLAKIKLIFVLLAVCFLAAPVGTRAAVVGEEMPFYVDSSYDALGRVALMSSLVEMGEHCYVYVESQWWNNLLSQNDAKVTIHNLIQEFDRNIYPHLTQVYGQPWEPGIDNDPKITILISRIQQGAGGYFNSADEYFRTQVAHSNEREMLYLNSSYFDTSRAKSFLAHEFQHLITFFQKDRLHSVSEEVWLNEARSEYAATIVGYDDSLPGSNLEKRIYDFYKNPSDSLTEWANTANDYGSVNLFMQYLAVHFGNQFFTKMVQSPNVGIASVNDALLSSGINEKFADVFMNWTIANYINDCRFGGQRYCYLNTVLDSNIRVPASMAKFIQGTDTPAVLSDSVKDWSGHWYKFSAASANLKLDFSGDLDSIFKVAYIVQKASGENEVHFIDLDTLKKGSVLISGLGQDVSSVILVPVSENALSGFGASEAFHKFSYSATLISSASSPVTPVQPPVPIITALAYPDGSLIRAQGDYKVYVINKGYKRWIQSSEVFKFYPHLGWAAVLEVTPGQRDWYKDSSLVRASGDQKVYEINSDGSKHWLNITAEQFSLSGRKWDSVYIINNAERNFYKTGTVVTK